MLNLLFIVFSLPIFTIPQSLTAVNRVLIKLVRDGNVLLWQEYIDEFKRSFGRNLLLGAIFGAALVLSYYLLSMGVSYMNTLFGTVFMALGFLALVWALGRGAYAFLMCAMFDLGVRDILKNARAMSAMPGGRGWAATLIPLVTVILSAALYPISVIALMLFGFSLTQFTTAYVLNTPIENNIISPWEAAKQEENEHEQ